MKIGAILLTSILLVEKIVLEKIQAKSILKIFTRNNKYIGAKDRKFLYDITFDLLKKYHGLLFICSIRNIDVSIRNLALLNFCNKFRNYNLDDLYQGKYSLKREKNDLAIYNNAIGYKDEIQPKFPDWIEKKVLNLSINKKKSLYQAILTKPKFDIAINTTKYSRDFVKKQLKKYGILSSFTKNSSVGITINNRIPNNILNKLKNDMFEIQDEGSQIMTLLTSAEPDTKILDFCAGKGTKTILINNLLKNKGFITAFDKFGERLEILKKRVKELNLYNINFDSATEYNKYYDLVLCDVPCTGTGTWRRRPENIIWLQSQDLEKNKLAQENILINASKLCKVGGRLVYITCSLLYDENDSQVEKFLYANKNFTIVSKKNYINKYFEKNIFIIGKYGITLFPDIINTDGYYISILKKLA